MQRLLDHQTQANSDISTLDTPFLADALAGLSAGRKSLPCKYLYDERGSQLFDRICELDEYYLTRTETQITADNAEAIAEAIGTGAVLVEYGSGSSLKTRVLLDHLQAPAAYIPVDISEEHLLGTARVLQNEYPELDVRPITADFTQGFDMPQGLNSERTCVYFPGSTIGNLEKHAAIRVLRLISEQIGSSGGLLIGFDLQKSREVLEQAYDDSLGVTASFTLNILRRANRELGADFDLSQFEHVSFYNAEAGRIEIYIESQCDQSVTIAGEQIEFEAGERIHIEYSHKYTISGFAQMAEAVGFSQRAVWTDDDNYFAVMYFEK